MLSLRAMEQLLSDYFREIGNKGYAEDRQADVKSVYDSIIQRFFSLQSHVVTLQKVEINLLQRIVLNLKQKLAAWKCF